MCLVIAAVEASAHYELLFAANRDERHARPSAAAHWWRDQPSIFGGRDLVARGSWLAVDRGGRLAAVTNFRESDTSAAPRSRGALVVDYLRDGGAIDDFAHALQARQDDYGPFSLLLRERGELRCVSNRAPAARLQRGVHALSNAAYGVEWPKVRSARAGMQELLESRAAVEGLFALLAERVSVRSAEERYMTSHFIEGEVYGTRSSTVVLVDRTGTLTVAERSFDSAARITHEVRESFELAEPRGARSAAREPL
jgi:uncharacterized protein with NRDE domain